jgi:hypothetical protein
MTRHLSPDEAVAALERTLDPARAAHLETCDRCRADIAGMRQMLTDIAAAADDHEPSPLFWDHFSDRVRVAAQATPSRAPAWRRLWQPAVGLAAAGIVVFWLVGRDGPGQSLPPAGSAGVSQSDAADTSAEPPWDAVVELAAGLSVDEIHGAVPLRLDTVALFDDLSADEQAALVELLEREMRGLE